MELYKIFCLDQAIYNIYRLSQLKLNSEITYCLLKESEEWWGQYFVELSWVQSTDQGVGEFNLF